MRRTSHQHGTLKLADRRKGKVLGVPMERSSSRRLGLSKERRRRDSGGVSNRIGSAVRCRCNPSNDQPTNPATTAQERERRDPRQALPGARTAGHFFKAEASDWKLRRASQVLFHAVCLRHLLEKVGSSTLAVIPSFRAESGGCRSVVENNAVGTWEPGQNQESDERLVFSCDPMGSGQNETRSRAYVRVRSA